jgi:hypothetical protein
MSDRLDAVKTKRPVADDTVWAFALDREFSVFGSELTDTSPCGMLSKAFAKHCMTLCSLQVMESTCKCSSWCRLAKMALLPSAS